MQDKGLKRNITDKFYTNKDTVKKCIDKIKENITINNKDLIIEPSAGNGAFIEDIKTFNTDYMFYDILPENDEITKSDFLDVDLECLSEKYNKIHIIGNPPFGRQSSLAIKFIKKCCDYAESISFILPKSFKKDSMKKHFPLNYHLICEMDIDEYSFLINNDKVNVPCVFQIWKYKNEKRSKDEKLESIGYKFVKRTEGPDISFRRVGVYAGKISRDTDKSDQSHYFIKFTKEYDIDKLNNISFTTDNTVGPKSISKQEIIREFNKILKT